MAGRWTGSLRDCDEAKPGPKGARVSHREAGCSKCARLAERVASTPPAAIVACHAQGRTPGDTDWSRIAGHYAGLMTIVNSLIIELNCAVAIGMALFDWDHRSWINEIVQLKSHLNSQKLGCPKIIALADIVAVIIFICTSIR